MNEIEQAKQFLRDEADPALVAAVEAKVESGEAHWRLDPHVDGVVGVVLTADPNRALVVVYVRDRDFECDETLLGI